MAAYRDGNVNLSYESSKTDDHYGTFSQQSEKQSGNQSDCSLGGEYSQASTDVESNLENSNSYEEKRRRGNAGESPQFSSPLGDSGLGSDSLDVDSGGKRSARNFTKRSSSVPIHKLKLYENRESDDERTALLSETSLESSSIQGSFRLSYTEGGESDLLRENFVSGHFDVRSSDFYDSLDYEQGVFTSRLEGGDRQKAMKRLRVPPLGEQQNPWTTFRVGLYSGIFIVLLVVTVLSAVFTKGEHVADWEPALRMYRGVFLIFLIIFLLGINTYGWRSSGVNHVLIFELDPRNNLTHQQLLEVAGFFLVIWAVSLVSYLLSGLIHIPVFANPLCLVGFCFLYLINPFRILHYSARKWLLRILYRIVTAPFHHVGFADFWLADQLNSLALVLGDLEFLICFYIFNIDWSKLALKDEMSVSCGSASYALPAIIACLPAWFRFAQCLRRYRDTRLVFPHIVNAGKYSTTFFVVIFSSLNSHYKSISTEDVSQNNAYFYLWVISAAISTCYTFAWDIKMDWGLLDFKNAGENKFLREEIVYEYKWYYYFAIIEDLVLRCAWTITVSVGEGGMLHGEVVKSVLGPLEVFRRFIWNFFRLENEHLNNCGQFRAVRDISIAPIDANDQALLEEMMDQDEGVTHRNHSNDKRKNYPRKYLTPLAVATGLMKPHKTDRLDKDRATKEETKVLIEEREDEDQ